MKIVIIGAGYSGITLANTLTNYIPNINIIVLEKNSQILQNMSIIHQFQEAEDLYPEQLIGTNIQLITDCECKEIIQNQVITTKDNYNFDFCFICTGFKCDEINLYDRNTYQQYQQQIENEDITIKGLNINSIQFCNEIHQKYQNKQIKIICTEQEMNFIINQLHRHKLLKYLNKINLELITESQDQYFNLIPIYNTIKYEKQQNIVQIGHINCYYQSLNSIKNQCIKIAYNLNRKLPIEFNNIYPWTINLNKWYLNRVGQFNENDKYIYVQDSFRPEFMPTHYIVHLYVYYNDKLEITAAQASSYHNCEYDIMQIGILIKQKKKIIDMLTNNDDFFQPHFNKPISLIELACLKYLGIGNIEYWKEGQYNTSEEKNTI